MKTLRAFRAAALGASLGGLVTAATGLGSYSVANRILQNTEANKLCETYSLQSTKARDELIKLKVDYAPISNTARYDIDKLDSAFAAGFVRASALKRQYESANTQLAYCQSLPPFQELNANVAIGYEPSSEFGKGLFLFLIGTACFTVATALIAYHEDKK